MVERLLFVHKGVDDHMNAHINPPREFYLVDAHIGDSYFVEVNKYDDNQVEDIEEVCETCGDNDWVMGIVKSKQDVKKLAMEYDYNPDYVDTMIKSYERLVSI